jgi:hypothetical protein
MTVAKFDDVRGQYLEVRALEDGGERGAATCRRYVDALRVYAEALPDEGRHLTIRQREGLEGGLASVELAVEPPHRPELVDEAVMKLRTAVDAADGAQDPIEN